MVQKSIIEDLKDRIIHGEFKPGTRLPGRVDFEQQYNTTPNTVQRAFTRLSEDGFVESISRRGTFVSATPPHLTNYELLIYSDHIPAGWGNNYWRTLDRVASELTRTTDRNISIRTAIAPEYNTKEYQALLEDIQGRRVAGLIFCFDPELAVGTPLLNTPDLPTIALSRHRVPGVPEVITDALQFWNQAFDYMVERGRKRLAIVAPPGMHSWLSQNLDQIAVEHKLTIDNAWLQSVDLKAPQWAENLVQLLLRGGPAERPDGLIVADDNFIDHACRGIIKSGLSLPDDIDVVGHANFPLAGTDVLPICRLGYDIHQVLTTAMDEIDRQRQGEPVPDRVVIPAVFADDLPDNKLSRNPLHNKNRPAQPAQEIAWQGNLEPMVPSGVTTSLKT